MKITRKLICLLLATFILMLSAGCGDGVSSAVNNSSDSNSTHRPIPEKEDVVVYEDNDHLFDFETVEWNGPDGYVIVVPKGNTSAKNSAKLLKDYYRDSFNIELSIVTDDTKPADKEIIIGKTNRQETDVTINEANLAVSVKGNKLVFDGGHNVTVDTAVKKYIRLAPEVNVAKTFSIETDFKSTLDDGYKYVWGDEFEGVGLDDSNWELIQKTNSHDLTITNLAGGFC